MKYILILFISSIFVFSCDDDDYLIDGGLANPNLGMSTSVFLKSNDQLDTLAILLEKADLLSAVDGEVTLFAPNNLSIKNYVNTRLAELRRVDPLAEFTINDIPKDTLTKYMGAYIFQGKLKREDLTKEGKVYTAFNGEERRLSLEPVQAYTGQLANYPEYVFYTSKVGDTWDLWNQNVDDFKVVIRTSNLESTNGVLHILQGSHILFNYKSNN